MRGKEALRSTPRRREAGRERVDGYEVKLKNLQRKPRINIKNRCTKSMAPGITVVTIIVIKVYNLCQYCLLCMVVFFHFQVIDLALKMPACCDFVLLVTSDVNHCGHVWSHWSTSVVSTSVSPSVVSTSLVLTSLVPTSLVSTSLVSTSLVSTSLVMRPNSHYPRLLHVKHTHVLYSKGKSARV